jgi:hypothetical protein
MRKMVDVEVILDGSRTDPKVTIYTKEKNARVDSIIDAVEKAAESDYPMIPGIDAERIELLAQRYIIRLFTEGRMIFLGTE